MPHTAFLTTAAAHFFVLRHFHSKSTLFGQIRAFSTQFMPFSSNYWAFSVKLTTRCQKKMILRKMRFTVFCIKLFVSTCFSTKFNSISFNFTQKTFHGVIILLVHHTWGHYFSQQIRNIYMGSTLILTNLTNIARFTKNSYLGSSFSLIGVIKFLENNYKIFVWGH